MTVASEGAAPRSPGIESTLTAVRGRLVLVGLLVGAAAVGWWWTAVQMEGMDAGPWTALGALSWFTGVWLVMMAAMMLPSVAPTVALYAHMTRGRSPVSPLAFTAGYLVVWGGVGVAAFGIGAALGDAGDALAWDRAGRWVAGATLVSAAAYELTPLKHACLGRCRSPLGFLLGAWRDGPVGGLRMGLRHATWCVGCCWALMASLFALGIMSVGWMAFVAGVIAFEKLVPSRGLAVVGTATVLAVLGVLLLVAPGAVPGLTIPADTGMQPMDGMDGMGGG